MAVAATRLMFQAGSRTISGSLGAKFPHCAMRLAQGGALPPAGDYEILSPAIDPMDGRLAMMTPAAGPSATRAFEKWIMAPDLAELWEKPLGASVSGKFFEKPDPVRGAAGGQVFVLGGRPVPGRNCIVVNSGFADLMDGSQTAGGAMVTVA